MKLSTMPIVYIEYEGVVLRLEGIERLNMETQLPDYNFYPIEELVNIPHKYITTIEHHGRKMVKGTIHVEETTELS